MYLRFTRDAVPEVYGPEQEFVIGKAITLREGTDAAIISIGDTVHIALEAAEELLKQGIKARVLDMHTIKPLDVEAVTKAVNECGKIVTVEDHNIINGLGSVDRCGYGPRRCQAYRHSRPVRSVGAVRETA